MTSKRGIIAAVSASVILIFGAGAVVTHARAAGGAGPNTSCTSTSPCLAESNTSTGDGVQGVSTKGVGVDGRTNAKGSTGAGAGFGVEGIDERTASGTGVYNAGVKGTSTNGDGVFGSGTFGVVGSGTLEGVLGETNPVGFGKTGGMAGVIGSNNTTSTSVYANGFGGDLFLGNNSSSEDVFVVDDGGNTTISGSATIGGGSAFTGVSIDSGGTSSDGTQSYGTNIGVEGITSPEGLSGSGGLAGIQGSNNTTSIAVRANGFGGLLFDGNNSSSVDVFTVDDSGNVAITGLITTGGACSGGCINGRSDSRLVEYAPREAEPTMEDFGEGRVVNGAGYVRLDPMFAKTINQTTSYMVFITPEGDNRGLYVTQKSIGGFMVRESQGGHSTLAFSYRIVAKPFGVTAPRLATTLVAKHVKERPTFKTAPLTHSAKPVLNH